MLWTPVAAVHGSEGKNGALFGQPSLCMFVLEMEQMQGVGQCC